MMQLQAKFYYQKYSQMQSQSTLFWQWGGMPPNPPSSSMLRTLGWWSVCFLVVDISKWTSHSQETSKVGASGMRLRILGIDYIDNDYNLCNCLHRPYQLTQSTYVYIVPYSSYLMYPTLWLSRYRYLSQCATLSFVRVVAQAPIETRALYLGRI